VGWERRLRPELTRAPGSGGQGRFRFLAKVRNPSEIRSPRTRWGIVPKLSEIVRNSRGITAVCPFRVFHFGSKMSEESRTRAGDTRGDTMGNLTAAQVKHAGPGRHGDGRGLYLQVVGNSRTWVLRYEHQKRERWMGLGSAES
jgi:hypothetical protein